ncbi:flagellar biosynthesis anti-sigma factor FlgM [Acidithiobacillus sp. AMEEHan]|uniref:flagellar biosynthesis anti-sigma factor FlgM n=1 Tax=Acidithiobacillus sp. AMEEHan TaxID=2994951 RepID=UPI0027E5750C|nr:flagellar biosynthesis anti-sigma factor FlgM [Acidithiobacillus sp. AMEEHan]
MDPIQPKYPITPVTADAPRGKTSAKTGSSAPSSVAQEQVTLSATAQALLHAGDDQSESSRIEALRAAVRSGSYVVSPAKIGQGLLQDQQQLLARPAPSTRA